MAWTRKDEERYLDKDERELVDRTHQPALGAVDDKELPDLKKLLRERRDRARDIAARQRREMRGKGGRPQGQEAARDDAGSRMKLAVLAKALKRLNNEATRREGKASRKAMVEGMRDSLERKQASKSRRPTSRSAGKGMKAKPNTKGENIADPREAGRVSQFVKQGQARRDSK